MHIGVLQDLLGHPVRLDRQANLAYTEHLEWMAHLEILAQLELLDQKAMQEALDRLEVPVDQVGPDHPEM